ncbi:MAG: B-box zinc finger protein [Chloroflexota bacterium]|nr:B-box zinc finger protein [Chloroflexota bacterium]
MTELSQTTYCANHPNKETNLRCNKCGKLICSKCAILTPIGYRCRECIRSQQKSFETAEWYDYVLGFIVAAGISFFGSLIAPKMGFFVLFIAPLVGFVIAGGTRLVTRRRRSKNLFITIAAGALLGGLPSLLWLVIPIIIFPQTNAILSILFSFLWHGAYVLMVTTTTYYRVSGLIFNR